MPDDRTVTAHSREQVVGRLRELSADSPKHTRDHRLHGAKQILYWLETFPGATWQQRWRNSTAYDRLRGWHPCHHRR
ncbi:hypothetical protein [Streptomyces tsukubensis]|uniref:hypothetical protein n=1 Tax=Streptomyces tsukubensis TaxID=83656 RepID=UPI00117E8A63|nr:hypothetical protein [Streptomyces tsukubensis]QFR97380.1 hypothetical protein GBW32_35310 [Streptomyces tsukubensis]